MKNILIIGGTGRVASFFIERILKEDKREFNTIISLSRGKNKANKFDDVIYLFKSKLDTDDIIKIITEYGISIILYTPSFIDANDHISVLASACENKIPVVFIGSAAMFTKIPNAKTRIPRLAKEDEIKNSGINYCIVRPTMIYGHKRDNNIYKLYKLLKKTRIIILPGGKKTKHNPISMYDLVEALYLITTKLTIDRQEINLAGPEPITMSEMIRTIKKGRIFIVYVNKNIVILLLKSLRKLGFKSWHYEKVQRFNEDKISDQSFAYLGKYGYKPTTFKETILNYD
jgi:nucleoside-diphosphate-sugar epimerase